MGGAAGVEDVAGVVDVDVGDKRMSFNDVMTT